MSLDKFNLKKTIELKGDINSCCISCFNNLAIGTSDKSVCVWEWTDEGFRETDYSPLLRHDYAVISVVFSPNGLTLASSSTDGMTYIFNAKTGSVKGSIVQSIGGGVRESAISPLPQKLLATVTDEGYIFLWSLENYQIQRYWLGHEACVLSLAFTPDSSLLVTADSDGSFKLWFVPRAVSNLYTVDSLCGYTVKDAHEGGMLTVAFSPNCYTELVTQDYQMCSGGDDNLLRLWHVSVEVVVVDGGGGQADHKMPGVRVAQLRVMEGHLSSVTCVRFSPDGLYLGSTSLDSSARLWEVSTGVCIRVLGGHRHSVFCCAFSSELGFFVSGSNDKTVNVWQLTEKPIPVKAYPENADEDLFEVQNMEQRSFKIIDVLKLNSHINSVDFNNQDLVVGGSNKVVRRLRHEGDEWKEVEPPMKGHQYSIASVEFSRCGFYLVSCSIDGSIIVWDYKSGEMVNKQFQLSSQGGRAARFCPSADTLALGGNDGKVYLWSVSAQAIGYSYPGHVEAVNCVAFTPDGEYLASGCAGGQVRLWKTNPACSICQLLVENVHDLGVMSCDFSSCFSKLKGSATKVYRLATGGNDGLVKVLRMWPVDELSVRAEEMFCLTGHGGSVTQVRFSNKSSDVLASTAIDRTARIWNMQNGQCLHVLSHHKSQVTCCAFSPDSTVFATGSLDSSVAVWEVPKVISLHHEYDKVTRTKLKLKGDHFDLDTVSLDEVQLSIEEMLSSLKRNSCQIPDHMLCPITQQVMTDPVICEDGFTYENHAIQAWMVNGRNTSPMTNVPLSSTVVVPNTALQAEIREFLLAHFNSNGNIN